MMYTGQIYILIKWLFIDYVHILIPSTGMFPVQSSVVCIIAFCKDSYVI